MYLSAVSHKLSSYYSFHPFYKSDIIDKVISKLLSTMQTKTKIDKSNHTASLDGWSKMVPKSKADKEEEPQKVKEEQEKCYTELEEKQEKERLHRSSHHSMNTNTRSNRQQ
jgi:hypothetical protein